MTTGPLGVGIQNDFVIESAVLSTDRAGGFSVDIKKLITDIGIYEHLDKPFLTGAVFLLDSANLIANFDFSGGEKFTVTLRANHTQGTIPVTKTFYVESILRTTKVNQSTETIELRLLEDVAFQSSVENVNKVYTGSPTKIITNIVHEFLQKDIFINPSPYQGSMKVIIPNLHPLEAAAWIKNQTTNVDGLPYYLFSTLVDDNLYLMDLGEMLKLEPMNKETPYTYSQANANKEDSRKHHIIQNYSHKGTEDLVKLIRDGNVGAQYQFYNTSNGIMQTVNFNVQEDAFNDILRKNYFSQDQYAYNYGVGYSLNEVPLVNYQSRVISKISSANTYNTANTLTEQSDDGSYKKSIISIALKNFLTKSPITIQVSGRDFLFGDVSRTIGNTIRIIFHDNNPESPQGIKIDTQKSGDYIIYATKHMFSIERYDIKLLCAKLANFVDDGAR